MSAEQKQQLATPASPINISVNDLLVLCQYVESSLTHSGLSFSDARLKVIPAYENVARFVHQWSETQKEAQQKAAEKKLETVKEEPEEEKSTTPPQQQA